MINRFTINVTNEQNVILALDNTSIVLNPRGAKSCIGFYYE